jgi:hypothetical protein
VRRLHKQSHTQALQCGREAAIRTCTRLVGVSLHRSSCTSWQSSPYLKVLLAFSCLSNCLFKDSSCRFCASSSHLHHTNDEQCRVNNTYKWRGIQLAPSGYTKRRV